MDRRVDSMLQSIFMEAASTVAAAGRAGHKLPQYQALARVVAGRMGGPQDFAPPAMQAWLDLICEIKMRNGSVVVCLGQLYVGVARHRTLLFKALADWLGLQCSIIKGRRCPGGWVGGRVVALGRRCAWGQMAGLLVCRGMWCMWRQAACLTAGGRAGRGPASAACPASCPRLAGPLGPTSHLPTFPFLHRRAT